MLEQLSIYFGALFAIAAGVRIYTKDLDDDLSPETREDLAIRLLCLDGSQSTDLFDWVNRVFDRIFGVRHFSWRCFFLSSAISAISFTVFFLYVASSNQGFNVTVELLSIFPFVVLLLGILVNVPSDYFALLETRWIMRRQMAAVWKILLDLGATYLIALGWLALLIGSQLGVKLGLTAYWVVTIDPIPLGSAIDYDISNGDGEGVLALTLLDVLVFYIFLTRIVLATSYVTSVWVWIYGASELCIRFFAKSKSFVRFLNVEERPARTLGLVASTLVVLLGTVAYPVISWISG